MKSANFEVYQAPLGNIFQRVVERAHLIAMSRVYPQWSPMIRLNLVIRNIIELELHNGSR